jgi:hypothetical protein
VPRQNGKNGVIEVRELFGMIALGERFLHTAHEVKTARKAFRRIASFFDETAGAPRELADLVVEIRKTNGQEAVMLRNGGSVEFIARSKGSGRGYTVDVLVLDEAQDLKDEELEALLPTISAAPTKNPQVILTGTPPDPEKGQTGEVFARLRRDYKRDARLAWTDFGVPDGPLPDADDKDLWYSTNPALGGRLNVAEVERERRMMSPAGFARERLGWWGDPTVVTASIFGAGRWETAKTTALPDAPDAIGIAVSIDRQWASIAAASVIDQVEDESDPEAEPVEAVVVAAVDRREGLAWAVARVKELQDRYDCPVVIDGKGPTKDLLVDLEDADVAVEVRSLDEYAEACSRFYDKVQAGGLRWSGDELAAAVKGAEWRSAGDRRVWGRKQSASDVSMLEAATLAAHAAETVSVFNIY